MNVGYLPAIAALAGSAIGGLTSFLATWLGYSEQTKAQQRLSDKARRQELYRDFVNNGSALYIDSLTSQTPDLGRLVGLYALVSRMRIISSPGVSEEAKCVVRDIYKAYFQSNKDLADITAMVDQDVFDPMKQFSELCRAELEGLN